MRVLHIITRLNVGGTASWLDQLTLSLQKSGHEVRILTGLTDKNEIPAVMSSECDIRFTPSLHKASNILKDFNSFWVIRKEIKLFNPTIINTHTSKAGLLTRLANVTLLNKRPKLVHTLHGHLLYGYFPKWKIRLITGIERFLGLFTDLVLVPGKNVAAEAKSAGLINHRKVIEVVPGVPIPSTQRFSQESQRLRVGWLGRLTQIKRPDRVIELASMFPDVDFFMGGDGELMRSLQDARPSNVYLLGWVDANQFWGRIDIALLTSDNEAMPISLIEAGMLGLPAVTTNVGSTSEVVINNKSGLVVGTSTSDLADALGKLIQSPELRTEYGENARTFTSSNFSPKNQLETHLQAYEIALGMKQ
jgi:glycosyltransferase involved in cell wall biosynthesis